MRKFSLREKAKTLLLCMASVNLGLSSDLPWLGIAFAVAFAVLLFRYDASNVPPYRKSIAYGLIVPFAIWWVLSPEMEYGMSPWLVFIPAYYLLTLAYLQKRSLGNGGYDVFVLFNGVAVLLLSCYQASRSGIFYNIFTLLFLLHAYARPRVKWWKHALFLLLFLALSAISFGGLKYWQSHGHTRAERVADYYAKRHLMGFDPVVKLGSFESNFAGKYNRDVVLRVWDTLAPEYMRAAVYEKYVGGLWKLPAHRDRMLYAARYKVDYAVFETRDSVSSADSTRPVWVQSALDNFGFIFAPYDAVAVAMKNADSVEYFKSNVFKQGETRRGDWFYYMPLPSGPTGPYVVGTYDSDTPDSAYLQVFAPLAGFLDTVAAEMGLDSISEKPAVLKPYRYSRAISNYFLRHFAYSLKVDESRAVAEGKIDPHSDPLRVFWATRSGYCEYYATLSVLLLRRAGIQARYVTGFARPEVVPGRPYALFRRNSSHAWVEMRNMGVWSSFDPTPPLFVVKIERPSWIDQKFESIRARAARIFHVLRDGEWRLALSSWQDAVQALVASPWLYALIAAVVAAVLLFRAVTKRRKQLPGSASASRSHWVRVLARAEKSLMHLGFVRMPGETVGCFLRRLEGDSPVTQKGRARFERALDEIRDYEKNRWRL